MNLMHFLPLVDYACTSPRDKVNFNNFTLSDAEAIRQGCYWDSTEADKLREFIQTYCLQSKDPYYGMPVELLQWQWKLIRNLLSWKRADGTLRYKYLSCWIPKKQGKSTLISCLMLHMLISIQGSLGIVVASTLEEAEIVFNTCTAMAEIHPALNELLWVRHSKRTIQYDETHSLIKMMAGTLTGKQGHQANYVVMDELAAWRNSHARQVWNALQGSTATKPNALKLIISTAQESMDTLGYEQYRRAKNILKGEQIDTTVLACVYEVPDGEDWRDIEVIKRANPSAGKLVPLQFYVDAINEATQSPNKEHEFRTLHCNQWGQQSGYISNKSWQACYKPFKEQELYGCECYIGCDWARAFDLAVVSIIARKEGKLYIIPRIYSPQGLAFRKSVSDGVPFLVWEKSKHIILTDGDVIHNDFIREQIQVDIGRFNVLKILYDPRGMEETRKILAEANPDIPVEEVDQNWNGLSAPTNIFERYVRDGLIVHNNNPCFNWCLSNVALKKDGYGRLFPCKGKSTRGRIDAVSATLTALVGWIYHEDQPEIDYTPFVL